MGISTYTYRLNCHSVAPRRRDRNREVYYTLLDLYYPVYFTLSETNLARWEEEEKNRDNTNFNPQPLLYWHVSSQLANPIASDIERRICKLVFKLELSESISKLSGTQHASSEVLLNKNIIQYEDEALMAERQRLKTDDSERVITESASLITQSRTPRSKLAMATPVSEPLNRFILDTFYEAFDISRQHLWFTTIEKEIQRWEDRVQNRFVGDLEA